MPEAATGEVDAEKKDVPQLWDGFQKHFEVGCPVQTCTSSSIECNLNYRFNWCEWFLTVLEL